MSGDAVVETNMKIIQTLLLLLIVLLYGCATRGPTYIDLTYSPQENINRLEEAGNIEVKVKVNDLRTEVSSLRTENEVGALVVSEPPFQHTPPLIAKNDLKELTAHAIETELINRGFKSGERVLIDVDLLKFYFYINHAHVFAEFILHVDVKNPDGILVFSKLVKGRGEYLENTFFWAKEESMIPLNAALKDGISRLVNDQEFIMALIKANRD
jgi:uncharacterized lipoprotein YajG